MSWGERSCTRENCIPKNCTMENCNVDCDQYVWDGKTKPDSQKHEMTCYFLIGNTYKIKGDLIAWGCHWLSDRKCWKTPPMDKSEYCFHRIESICLAFGVEMVPEKLSDECKKIQKIINKVFSDEQDNT